LLRQNKYSRVSSLTPDSFNCFFFIHQQIQIQFSYIRYPPFNMTLYTIPNSVEDIDPHKQPQQNPPGYSPLPEHASVHQNQDQERQSPPFEEQASGKPTMGERFHKVSSKAGWPINKAANVGGAEGFWPSSLDRECNKAARILYSFTGKISKPLPC
jgi:SH3 domain-containing YSC84-like protein 1